MTPATTQGQLFLIFFAILGIPLMMVFLANVGVYINKGCAKLSGSMTCFKNPKLERFADTIFLCSVGIALFVLAPAGIFHYIEDWSYITACYYAIVTLSTMGFGDYIAGNN